ncbi:hypothetical protein FQN54_005629 [Arachnomyces sp. PD_36]|nr:hypothetical protein FQN54_005629 [Arachnomyces sp. PD_36]
MNGRERSRPPPSNLPPQKERRPPEGYRHGGKNQGSGGSMSRAEKFEDEKRRIIQSCFSKKDPDGSVIESYITHIRVTEDAAYPSSPPAPNSPPENNKARVVIVAVRKSGRVRMHKARENSDASFSIGKTWVLDDLSAVQSYASLVPANPQEQQQKQWAGDVGFIVTVGKPYYWQAATGKEKDFFIGSLVKIYKKYTGGKTPNLLGFSNRERELLTGAASQGPSSQAPPGLQPSRSHGPIASKSETSLPPKTPPGPSQAPPRPQPPRTNRTPSHEGNRELRKPPSHDQFPRQRSQERMQRPPPQTTSSRPRPPIPPTQSSQPPRSRDGPPRSRDGPPRSRDGSSQLSNDRQDVNGYLPAPSGPIEPMQSRLAGPSSDSLPIQIPDDLSRSQAGSTENLTLGSKPSMDDKRSFPETGYRPSLEAAKSTPDLRTDKQSSFDQEWEPMPRPSAQRPPGSFGQDSMRSESNEVFSTPLTVPEPLNAENRSPSRGSERSLEPTASIPPLTIPSSLRPGSSLGDHDDKTASPPAEPAEPAKEPATESFKDPFKQPSQPVEEPAEEPVKESAKETTKEPTPSVSSRSIKTDTAPSEEPTISSPPSSKPDTPSSEPGDEASHRPGLGPMMKKKMGGGGVDVANTFRKAATAYNAFKPRAGGAAERMKAMKAMDEKEKNKEEPDGITGVVPAPLLRGKSDSTDVPTQESLAKETPTPPQQQQEPVVAQEPPNVKITEAPPVAEEQAGSGVDESGPKSPASQGERRRKRREDNTAKYCNALNIDPSLLEGRGVDFDAILTDLGWDGRLGEDKKVEDLEADIRREIGRVQASSWLGHLEQQEGKVDQLARLFDKTIDECEELDGLLTLYSHELNTLADDVAYIEAQSQGLQVQTANQKLLQNELQSLLKTISISSSDLRSLRESPLGTPDGVKETEAALSTLYKAMLTIDSDIRPNKKRLADAVGEHGSVGVYADTEIGQMRAVMDKKLEYRRDAQLFLQKLQQHMATSFRVAEQKTMETITQSGGRGDTRRLDPNIHEHARQELWMYNGLMLFARDVLTSEWMEIINIYEQRTKQPYQNEFRDNALVWKKGVRKATGDETELLFTQQEKEKESDGLTTAARKLTVRRGKTVRTTAGTRVSFGGERKDGKLEPFEAFTGVLDETTKSIAEEQNFVVQFFHLNSLSTLDFTDIVSAAAPEHRRRPNPSARQSHDPDRDMAKKVEQVMDDIYSYWPTDLQNLMNWVVSSDQLQGVGVLCALERKIFHYEETNQEYIVRSLQKLHTRLVGLFNRFVDEQIRAIEDTKVKIKKRKGVISFMRVFPNFSTAIENMIAGPSHEQLDVRTSVNGAYTKINRAMWESLNFIAKEAPGQQPIAAGSAGDPEDKEALNYHILLIENMNHYIEEVDVRENAILEEWRGRAVHDMNEHMKLYLDAVIRRPLGKLLDFIESTETLLVNVSTPSDISTRASHARYIAKKVLTNHDAKEIKRGIETLKKRVEKHFGDADDPGLSRSLVVKVLKECEGRYVDIHDRMRRIIEGVYEGQLEMDWRKEEAVAMFKR